MRRLFGSVLWAVVLAVTAFAASPVRAQVLDVKAALADRVLGDPKAPVTIYDYASLTCPHCAHFNNTILPELKAKYIDTGKVKFIFRDFPLDGAALLAAQMARCLPAERYYPMVDLLFKQQSNWAHNGDPKRSIGQLGKLAGLPESALEACWANTELANGIVKMRADGERNYKVSSTPTFIVNDGAAKIDGAQDIGAFAKIIDPLLK